MIRRIFSDKDYLIAFIAGGIFWSILYILILIVRMGLLVSEGKLLIE